MTFKRDIFSVPIFQGNHENKVFHEKLRQLCYKWKNKPETNGLVSESWDLGRQSDNQEEKDKEGVTTFLSSNLRDHPEWRECANFIADMSTHMLTESHNLANVKISVGNLWTTFYPQGGYIPQHVHGNCLMSGVYYVQAEENTCDIVFTDPAWISKTMLNLRGVLKEFPTEGVKFHVPIKENLMLIFPAWLPHHTLQNKSTKDRIIISFNLVFDVYDDSMPPLEGGPILCTNCKGTV